MAALASLLIALRWKVPILGGETRDQALERVKDAVKLILDEMRDEGKPVPPNSAVMELESPAVLVTV